MGNLLSKLWKPEDQSKPRYAFAYLENLVSLEMLDTPDDQSSKLSRAQEMKIAAIATMKEILQRILTTGPCKSPVSSEPAPSYQSDSETSFSSDFYSQYLEKSYHYEITFHKHEEPRVPYVRKLKRLQNDKVTVVRKIRRRIKNEEYDRLEGFVKTTNNEKCNDEVINKNTRSESRELISGSSARVTEDYKKFQHPEEIGNLYEGLLETNGNSESHCLPSTKSNEKISYLEIPCQTNVEIDVNYNRKKVSYVPTRSATKKKKSEVSKSKKEIQFLVRFDRKRTGLPIMTDDSVSQLGMEPKLIAAYKEKVITKRRLREEALKTATEDKKTSKPKKESCWKRYSPNWILKCFTRMSRITGKSLDHSSSWRSFGARSSHIFNKKNKVAPEETHSGSDRFEFGEVSSVNIV